MVCDMAAPEGSVTRPAVAPVLDVVCAKALAVGVGRSNNPNRLFAASLFLRSILVLLSQTDAASRALFHFENLEVELLKTMLMCPATSVARSQQTLHIEVWTESPQFLIALIMINKAFVNGQIMHNSQELGVESFVVYGQKCFCKVGFVLFL